MKIINLFQTIPNKYTCTKIQTKEIVLEDTHKNEERGDYV
jgi:hypothetical protein